MAKNDKDLKIGIAAEYDPAGAKAALADMEKLKGAQAAAGSPQGGGSAAAAAPARAAADAGGEEALTRAREKTAEATARAAGASKELAEARNGGKPATEAAAEGEKALAEERKASAEAAGAAAEAEDAAAGKKEAAALRKRAAAETEADARAKEQKEIEAIKAQMALEAKGRAGLIKELERLGKARMAAAKAGDVAAFRALEEQMGKTRAAFERMNQGLEITRLGMMGQMQVAMGAMGAIQSLGAEMKNGTPSVMGMASAVYALGAAIKAGMGPVGWIMMAIQGLAMAWDWYSGKQEAAAEAEHERMEAEQEALRQHWEAVEKMAGLERGNALGQWKRELEGIGARYDGLRGQAEAAARRRETEEAAAEERRKLAAQSAYEAEEARVELARTLGEITEEEAARRKAAAEEAKAAEIQAAEEAALARANARRREARDAARREAEELEEALRGKFGGFEELLAVKLPTEAEWNALRSRLDAGLGGMQDATLSRAVQEKILEVRGLLADMGIAWQGADAELLKWLDSMREAREAGVARTRELRALAEAERAAALEARLQLEQKQAEAQADAERRRAARAQEVARLRQAELAAQWQQAQCGTLAEQEAWLERTAAGFAAGSAEAQRWAEALRGVRLRRVAEEAAALGERFATAGRYAGQDARTLDEMHRADEAALRQRREALEALRRTPGLDAATLRALNAKIRETDSQAQGLRRAMAQAAVQAQQAVEALRPLGQKARTSVMRTALRRSEAAYVKLARLAERQASRGDEAGMERSIRALNRYALQQERLTGFTGRAAERQRDVAAKLRSIAQGTEAQDRGLTAAQRQQNRVLQALGQERRYNARKTAGSKRAAAAQEKEARAREQAAKKAQAEARRQQPRNQASRTAELTAKLTEATGALAEQRQQLLRLNGQIVALAAEARAAAAAAADGASAAAAQAAGLRRDVANLQRAVERMKQR